MNIRLAGFTGFVAVLLAGCGGSGGGDVAAAPPPPLASGQLDPSYGAGGKASTAYSGFPRMTVDAHGSVYVTSNAIFKLGSIGEPVATHVLAPMPDIISSPLVDEAGNVYVVYGAGVAKIDFEGRLVASFGTGGVAIHPSWDAGIWKSFSRVARDADGSLYLAGVKATADESIHWMAIAKFDRDGRVAADFGNMGMRTLDVSSHAFTRGIAVDRGGSIFLAGDVRDGSLVVVKLEAQGALAADFASGGIWRSMACNSPEGATAIATDAAGNTLVAGNCTDSPGTRGRARLFKLDPRGAVVPSFRDAGLQAGLFGLGSGGAEPASYLTAIVVSDRGETYVAGTRGDLATTCFEPGADFAVARLDENGSPVRTFGSGGVTVLDSGSEWGSDLGIDGEGRIYVGGGSLGCSSPNRASVSFVVFRLGG